MTTGTSQRSAGHDRWQRPGTAYRWLHLSALVFGLSFLYLPIVLLVIYSFNASRLVTVWGGFSTQWYVTLWSNQGLLAAAWVTLQLGLAVATVATVLGTLAGYVLSRRRFRGRGLMAGMIYAPLIMPEVITGLALLLTFVALSLDRGFVTVMLAHITFTMCYVAVVVQSRLHGMNPHLEEVARDLGCSPTKSFFLVTLPVIWPAVAAGWLLSFTLSLDDLVIASFTTGPGATTLPMKIYSAARLGVNPEINALSTLLIGLVAMAVFVAAWVGHRRVP